MHQTVTELLRNKNYKKLKEILNEELNPADVAQLQNP